jgi:hypothetical protein
LERYQVPGQSEAAEAIETPELDFAAGVYVFCVAKIEEQYHPGEKVPFDLGTPAGPRLTMVLDDDDNLLLRVTDAAGQTWSTATIPKEKLFKKWRAYAFGVQKMDGGDNYLAFLTSSDGSRVQVIFEPLWSTAKPMQSIIGSDMDKERFAALAQSRNSA